MSSEHETLKSETHSMLRSSVTSVSLVVSLVVAVAFAFYVDLVNAKSSTQNGQISVDLGDVYKKGDTRIELFDLTSLPQLPAGYAPISKQGFKITAAGVSGPHVVRFRVASVTSPADFANFRVFHVEPYTFDPDSPMWVDRTLQSTDAPATNFATKTITAKSEWLGVFVVAKLVEPALVNTAVTDLVVTSEANPSQVVAPNPVNFAIKIVNEGPNPATGVGIINNYSTLATLVAVTPSQGTCKERSGNIYCVLGGLAVGAAARIDVLIKPYEDIASFHKTGREVHNDVFAAGAEGDPNTANNKSSSTVIAFPDPNQPPTVVIEDPKSQALFVGPATISIKAKAWDADGTIERVEFFDNGKSIGIGASAGNHFTITERDLAFGPHSFIAIATDNGGRRSISSAANVVVNGYAKIEFTNPAPATVIAPQGKLLVTLRVTHPSRSIRKVEIFDGSGLLGEAVSKESSTHDFTVDRLARGVYSFFAIATDDSGIATTSSPLTVIVDEYPSVSIVRPAHGSSSLFTGAFTISAVASHPTGEVSKVDFFANEVLLESVTEAIGTEYTASGVVLPDGSYTLTAVATDDLGVTRRSKPVKVMVRAEKN